MNCYELLATRSFFNIRRSLLAKFTHKEKEIWVDEARDRFVQIDNLIVTEYKGLNVEEISELRSRLRKTGYSYQVIKNRLMKLAFSTGEFEGIRELFRGPIAIAYGEGELTSVAKVFKDFCKEHENLKVTGGLIDGEIVSVDQIKSIANLPPREIILAQLGQTILGPIRGLVNVLQGTIRQFVYVLEAIRKKEE